MNGYSLVKATRPAGPHRPVYDIPDPGMRPQCRICGCGKSHRNHAIPAPRPVPSTEGREP